MKFKKENLSNFDLLVLAGVLLFTPVGFHARVLISRVLSFSPSILHKNEQLVLVDFDWKLTNQKEEVIAFEDIKGEVVLVNYWATWCPPCVAEMPSLQELYDDYGNKVKFIMIAHDDREKVKSFLEKKKYNFPVYFEKSSSPDALAIESIPTTFIIDREGRIVVNKTGAANWNSEATRELVENLLLK